MDLANVNHDQRKATVEKLGVSGLTYFFMTQNPWKLVQRALRALTSRGKAKIEILKRKASKKSLPVLSPEQEWWRRRSGGGVRHRPLALRAGRPGSRPWRWLDDAAVARARIKSTDAAHQQRFLSRTQRYFDSMKFWMEKQDGR